MDTQTQQAGLAFYNDVINWSRTEYAGFFEKNAGLIKVLHAFDDKVALVRALEQQGLLLGLAFKESSAKTHPEIVADIIQRSYCSHKLIEANDDKIVHLSSRLTDIIKDRSFVVGDHGGYFTETITSLLDKFPNQFLGVTEHTVNGEERFKDKFDRSPITIPYISNARLSLKQESDTYIASKIVTAVLEQQSLGGCDTQKILVIGYGTMGAYAAHSIKKIFPRAELLIYDIDSEKRQLAQYHGYKAIANTGGSISSADVIFLCTNNIQNRGAILDSSQINAIRSDVLIASMTSIDDELSHEALLSRGVRLFNNGYAGNTHFTDGGSGHSIYKVEAAGLITAFKIGCFGQCAQPVSEKDVQAINRCWDRHFT